MGATVPAQYRGYVASAAKALGIPEQVVVEQINLESSFNPNAKSPAGAEGIAQFEPATFETFGHGSPYNVADAFAAYTAYMKDLLRDESGDLRNALAAYNAGPLDLKAGYGYADTILSRAGTGDTTATGAGTSVGPVSTAGTSGGGLIQVPAQITGFFSKGVDDLTQVGKWSTAFFSPSSYIRIGAGIFGFVFLVLAIVCLGREAGKVVP